jgi:hypothetical protein
MKRKIVLAVITLVFAVAVYASITVTFVGPETYADDEWQTVKITNKGVGIPPSTSYVGIIEVCPSGAPPGIVSQCSTTTATFDELPESAQTVVNYLITSWCSEHSDYCEAP